MLLNVLGNKR